jgi:ferredoxin--NADP+ reductase
LSFLITDKNVLAENIKEIDVRAPYIASKSLPGQFIILRIDQKGERIPLTIVSKDDSKETIRLIFQEVGLSTRKLGRLCPGDYLLDVLGPLGRPFEAKKFARPVIGIGGGVGIAELLPICRSLKEKDNYLIVILGARNKDLLILEDSLKECSDKLYIATDDGSYGQKGLVSDVLAELLEQGKDEDSKVADLVYAVGPTPMMQVVSEITRPFAIPTIVSLNPIMVDGTGMCGSCRVSLKGEIKFACVDGPNFDGHMVDFQELRNRLDLFKKQEELARQTLKGF